jgi:hypothetical protein
MKALWFLVWVQLGLGVAGSFVVLVLFLSHMCLVKIFFVNFFIDTL